MLLEKDFGKTIKSLPFFRKSRKISFAFLVLSFELGNLKPKTLNSKLKETPQYFYLSFQ